MEHRKILDTFDIDTLPDLDVAVLGALELFSEQKLPPLDLTHFKHPLVLGSGNAEAVGRLIFHEHDAIYANESTCATKLRNARDGIQNAVIISASGKKHAPEVAENLKSRGIRTWLLTNDPEAPARAHVDEEHVFVFPRNREPYTYNTSTYMGMLLSATKEDPEKIRTFIDGAVRPCVPETLGRYDSFYFILPARFEVLCDMMTTKFDELFGARVSGRAYTYEQTKHAKTVVPCETELFVSFGEENTVFGDPKRRIHIPLPESAGPATMMAIGYYLVGYIQKQHPPYFKDHIQEYVEHASQVFGQTLHVITG